MVVDRSISNRALTRFAVVASNLLPLLGVFLLDWSAHTLLGIFVLELCVVVFWTVVKTPFAEKRPHNGLENSSKLFGPLQAKRGAIRLSRRLPPVYPRNLPLMLMLAFILGPLELVVGFIVFALSEPGVTTAMVASLFVGGIAVFCSRGVEFWAEYMRNEAYRDHSPRSLALTPLKQFFGVGLLFVCLLFLSAGTAETGQSIIGGNVLLTVIVGVKLAYELRSTSLAETNDKRGIFTRLYGSHRTEIEPIPVETPDAEPKMYVKPRFGGMVVDSLYHGVVYALTTGGLFVYSVGILFGLRSPIDGLVAASVIATPFIIARAVTRYVQYGTVAYRFYDDVVVVHDTWLDEPQKRLEIDAITEYSSSRNVVNRVFDTKTVELETEVEEQKIPIVKLSAPEEAPEDDANNDQPITLVQIGGGFSACFTSHR